MEHDPSAPVLKLLNRLRQARHSRRQAIRTLARLHGDGEQTEPGQTFGLSLFQSQSPAFSRPDYHKDLS